MTDWYAFSVYPATRWGESFGSIQPRKCRVPAWSRGQLDNFTRCKDLHPQPEAGCQLFKRKSIQRLPGMGRAAAGLYYLSAESPGWWQSYPVFNMTGVNFGPSTLALMNQSGGVVNPSSQLLSVMENSSWPIYVTSPYQIVFHLQAPFLWFLGTLVSYVGLTFDTQFVLDHGGFGAPASLNTYFDTNPVPGTGPYTITGVSVNSYMTFQQNPNYWGKSLTAAQIAANPILDQGHVNKVIIYYKADDLARYTDLSTGVAQIAAISSEDWNLILANPSKYSYEVLPPWAGLSVDVTLNTNEYPTNITAVRQAIVHAINYTDVADKAFFGEVTPTMGPEYPAWSNFYDIW